MQKLAIFIKKIEGKHAKEYHKKYHEISNHCHYTEELSSSNKKEVIGTDKSRKGIPKTISCNLQFFDSTILLAKSLWKPVTDLAEG